MFARCEVKIRIQQPDWLTKKRTFPPTNHVAEFLFLLCAAWKNLPSEKPPIHSMIWPKQAIFLISSVPGNCTETISVDSYRSSGFIPCSNLKGYGRTKHEMDYKRKSDRVLCFKAKSGRVQISCNYERIFWHYCAFNELRVYDGCNGTTVASQRVQPYKYWSPKWTSKKTSCLKVAWFKDMSWREKLCIRLEGREARLLITEYKSFIFISSAVNHDHLTANSHQLSFSFDPGFTPDFTIRVLQLAVSLSPGAEQN